MEEQKRKPGGRGSGHPTPRECGRVALRSAPSEKRHLSERLGDPAVPAVVTTMSACRSTPW